MAFLAIADTLEAPDRIRYLCTTFGRLLLTYQAANPKARKSEDRGAPDRCGAAFDDVSTPPLTSFDPELIAQARSGEFT